MAKAETYKNKYDDMHFAIGEYVDKQNRFKYVGEAGKTAKGKRRICVENAVTGERYSGLISRILGKLESDMSDRCLDGYKSGAEKRGRYHEGDIINKAGTPVKIISLDAAKYPPYVRSDGRTDRCGLFLNMTTGEQFIAKLAYVASGYTGGDTEFSGENRIARALDELGIRYERQKSFETCIGFVAGASKRPCFDFYIEELNLLIEFDGSQHTLQWNRAGQQYLNHRSEYEYYLSCARDVLKESWCVKNGKHLLRLGYRRPRNITSQWIEAALAAAERQYEDGKNIVYYPENIADDYEPISVILSHLSEQDQMIFIDHISDRTYRRPIDKNNDKKLAMALPTDGSVPVVFDTHEEAHDYQFKRKKYSYGDVVGPNGVKFISNMLDGVPIKPTPSGKTRALFECPCGNRFVATFGAVKGYGEENGALCDECTNRRRKELFEQKDLRRLSFESGDVVDPDGKFEFVKEVTDDSDKTGRRLLVREVDSGNVVEHSLNRLRTGHAKTVAERTENISARGKKRRTYRTGYVFETQYGQFEIVDDNPLDEGNRPPSNRHMTFKRLSDGAIFTARASGIIYGKSGGDLIIGHQIGDVIGDNGVVFLGWNDANGNPIPAHVTANGEKYKQGRFKCQCGNEFISTIHAVAYRNAVCPECLDKRHKEATRKQTEKTKIPRIVGEPIDPNNRYIYLGPDNDATTKNEKVIVKDAVTGEVFSALWTRIREGIAQSPSEAEENRKRGHESREKYKVGAIIDPENNIRIVAELPRTEYKKRNGQKQKVRRFVFRNLTTGMLFDGIPGPIVNGTVKGTRANKTEADYPDIDIFPEPSDE